MPGPLYRDASGPAIPVHREASLKNEPWRPAIGVIFFGLSLLWRRVHWARPVRHSGLGVGRDAAPVPALSTSHGCPMCRNLSASFVADPQFPFLSHPFRLLISGRRRARPSTRQFHVLPLPSPAIWRLVCAARRAGGFHAALQRAAGEATPSSALSGSERILP